MNNATHAPTDEGTDEDTNEGADDGTKSDADVDTRENADDDAPEDRDVARDKATKAEADDVVVAGHQPDGSPLETLRQRHAQEILASHVWQENPNPLVKQPVDKGVPVIHELDGILGHELVDRLLHSKEEIPDLARLLLSDGDGVLELHDALHNVVVQLVQVEEPVDVAGVVLDPGENRLETRQQTHKTIGVGLHVFTRKAGTQSQRHAKTQRR